MKIVCITPAGGCCGPEEEVTARLNGFARNIDKRHNGQRRQQLAGRIYA